AESAQVVVISSEITAFAIDSLFDLQVQKTRFSLSRSVAPQILICDLVTRIFTDLLPLTPIGSMGINRTVHFSVGDSEKRDRIGEILAPRAPWGEWGKEVSSGE